MNQNNLSQGRSLFKGRRNSFFIATSGFILLILFCATLVTANSISLTDPEHPLVSLPVKINLTFNKEVSIVSAQLLSNNEIFGLYASGKFKDQGDHKNFLLIIPSSNLPPANYSLKIEKKTLPASTDSSFDEVTFTYLPENRIFLEPNHDLNVVSQTSGYSSTKPYNVYVGTNRPANCNYTTSSGPPKTEFSTPSSPIHHIIKDFNFSSADIKVNCTFSDQTTDERILHVGFIHNGPDFSVTITPPKLMDPENMWLNISVSDNNQIPLKLFCTAKIDGQNYSFADHKGYSDIASDMTLSSSFQLNPWLHIRYSKESTESFVVPVNIKCWNLAGTSATVSKSFEVALNYPLNITIESPEEFTKTKQPTLAVTIWRGPEQQVSADSCVVKDTDGVQKTLTPADPNQKLLFSTTLPTLEEGINKYSVDCKLSSGEVVSKNLMITLDTTSPTGYALSVPTYVCLGDSLRANIDLTNGAIPENNFRGYLYNLYVNAVNGQALITSGEVPSSPIIYSLNQEDQLLGRGYEWETNVVDLAGNSEATTPPSAITALLEAKDIECDHNPPVIIFTQFTSNNILSINVSCNDAEGNCANYFNHSFVQDNLSLADCKAQAGNMITSPYSSPIQIYHQGTLCVVGWDNASNTRWVNYKPDISGVCTSDDECPNSEKCDPVTGECLDITHCSNGQLDEADGETDVDCAGLCDACVDGKNCSSNDDCESSLCENNVCEPISCIDKEKNGNETDFNCGGPLCGACGNGKVCSSNNDCNSSFCEHNICELISCVDGVKNYDETDVDCGGSCEPCVDGKNCSSDDDCESFFCVNNVCEVGSCTDEVKNDDETDVDCGGSCGACDDGKVCLYNNDCNSSFCLNNVCEPTACNDSLKDYYETDVDCGGPCQACGHWKGCLSNDDCESSFCLNNICEAGSCTDNAKNGNETDVDCGGSCQACVDGKNCSSNDDCKSSFCNNNICEPISCNDNTKNNYETDVDCGGYFCGACADGKVCSSNDDCESSFCKNNICKVGSCTDGVKNGNETDVDCGGPCHACGNEEECLSNDDCKSSFCLNNTCEPISCVDGVKNYDETDVDCGGLCDACGNGDGCLSNYDCESFFCDNNVCGVGSCTDEVKNGRETDVDCGGLCDACGDGKNCSSNDDCESSFCEHKTCESISCVDGVKDGDETDVDCGGSCGACGDGKNCLSNDDCESSLCKNNVCEVGSCTDEVKNGHETDVDCGGPCGACDEGGACLSNDDCKSSFCGNNVCEVVSCNDGVKNGYETDVDCGGPTCPTCPDDLDADQDGIPDGWERDNGLDPNDPSDATQDPDGDGYSNYQEYRNGTDPYVFDGQKSVLPEQPGDISKGFSMWGLILLILGLLTMSGSGYWLYYLHEDESKEGLPPFQRTAGRSSQQSRISTINNRGLPQQPGRLEGLQRNQILLKREQEREAKRRRLLGELGVEGGAVKSKEGLQERTNSKSLGSSAGRLGEKSSFVSLDKVGQSKKPVQKQSTTQSQFDAFSELDEVIEKDEKMKSKNGKKKGGVKGSKAKESQQSQDTKGSGDKAGKSSSTSTRTTQSGARRG